MNHSEAVAKRVLEAVLHGTRLEYRTVQSNGEWDFDLQYDNRTIAAVEVTSAVNEPHVRTLAAIYDPRKGGPVIQPTACKKSWVIFPAIGASIDAIRANADRYLAALEQEEIDSFFWVRRDSPSVQEICRQLQVTGGAVISSDGEPAIEIGRPIGAGDVGARRAIEAGEKEARKQDNRKKLGAAKTVERHLVVYIPAGSLPWTALTSFVPPATLPRIPEEITNLWLIGHSENKDEFVVWYASTNETWRSTKVVCASETPRHESCNKMP